MPSQPFVSIILLNYQGCKDTFACLDSLVQLEYQPYRIIVVDNASPDDSVIRLKDRLQKNPDEFILIESPENGGFSSGNNLGISFVLKDEGNNQGYVWLLNNDTTVHPDCLTHLVAEVERSRKHNPNQNYSLVGPLILYPDSAYQQIGCQINWWTGRVKGYPDPRNSDASSSRKPVKAINETYNVDALSGASLLIPLPVFQQVGLMDPSFFLYFEDVAFSVRCAKAGFNLTVALEAIVYHQEGATTGRKSLSTQYYYHRNRLRMLFLYANPCQKICISLYTLFRLFRSAFKTICRGNPESPELFTQIQAIWDFIRGVSGPYAKR